MQPRIISASASSPESPCHPVRDHHSSKKNSGEPSIIAKLPSFLHFDIGRFHPSDQEITRFISTLSTFIRNQTVLSSDIADRATSILNQLISRTQQTYTRSQYPIFLFPNSINITGHIEDEGSPWDVLLSARNNRLSTAVLNILKTECLHITSSDQGIELNAIFVSAIISALDEQTLLSTVSQTVS